jgi:MFS family permease
MVGTSNHTFRLLFTDHTLQHSIFYATQAMTVMHWSRTSDLVGRKPIVLTGLFGLSLSMYGFGLSRTYWVAVFRFVGHRTWIGFLMSTTFSRSLNGALNGNIGVLKSMMAEIADSSDDLARIYGYVPIAWLAGSTLGQAAASFA